MKPYFVLIIIAIFLFSSCENSRIYTIETDYGIMKIKLLDSTPKHKENFIKLVKEKYYDGLLFHRVIQNMVIQGGDPDSRNAPPDAKLGIGGPGYEIPAEIGVPHFKGMVAAARQGDILNPNKMSSGSQFYIVQGYPIDDRELDVIEKAKNIKYTPAQREKYKRLGGAPMLDKDYTVFGEIIEGLDALDKIAAVKTDDFNRPLQDIKMKIY